MKITLVGTCSSPEATGLRSISALLKSKGYSVKLIFLTTKRGEKTAASYNSDLTNQLVDMVKDSDLIGISLMTNTFYQAKDITSAIKQAHIKAPVVWGGVHPTVAPESCMDFTDIVCVGEGEWPMVDLADAVNNKKDFCHIPNLWVKSNGQIIKNDVRPLFENLDRLPFPDYEINDNQFLVHKGKIVPASPKNMKGTLIRYRLLSTRGCPYNCAFCCNSTWINLYRQKGKWVRKRSIPNVIAELENIKNKFPSVNSMSIADDTFFVRDEEEFKLFAELYSEKIRWPFEINTHPATIDEQKIKILHNCGCALIKMGIQSGSQDTNYNIFNRKVPNETIIKAIQILNRFPNLQKEFHYIVSNPFEPDENLRQTLHFAAENHSGNFRTLIFPLALFPGSDIYKRAKQTGIITSEQFEIYEKVYSGKEKRRFDRLGYHTMLLQAVTNLQRKKIPSPILHKFIDTMLAKPIRFCLDRKWFKLTIFGAYMVSRSLSGIIYQIFLRPFYKHKRQYNIDTST